jgi:Mor family transcriptional regulator
MLPVKEVAPVKYCNAEEVLPRHLLTEIQKYVEGVQIYVPKGSGNRLGWGERNGQKGRLYQRNRQIRAEFRTGADIEELMAKYHLGYESIRKIVYRRSV